MRLSHTLFSVLLISFTSIQAIADPLWLATPEETRESNNSKPPFIAKVVPPLDAPTIEVVALNLDGPIGSPTPIVLKFTSKAPATVKPESFKAYYGSFQIDITGRLLGIAQVTPHGINLKEASLPKGGHTITIYVQDSEGRLGSKTITFEIN